MVRSRRNNIISSFHGGWLLWNLKLLESRKIVASILRQYSTIRFPVPDLDCCWLLVVKPDSSILSSFRDKQDSDKQKPASTSNKHEAIFFIYWEEEEEDWSLYGYHQWWMSQSPIVVRFVFGWYCFYYYSTPHTGFKSYHWRMIVTNNPAVDKEGGAGRERKG